MWGTEGPAAYTEVLALSISAVLTVSWLGARTQKQKELCPWGLSETLWGFLTQLITLPQPRELGFRGFLHSVK